MASSEIAPSAYSSASSLLEVGQKQILLEPVYKVTNQHVTMFSIEHLLRSILVVLRFMVVIYYFPANQVIMLYILELLTNLIAVPVHSGFSYITYMQSIKYVEQHTTKVANKYYAYTWFFRLLYYILAGILFTVIGPVVFKDLLIVDQKAKNCYYFYIWFSLLACGQDYETTILLNLNHYYISKLILNLFFDSMELLCFLIYGINLYIAKEPYSFYMVVGISLVKYTLPNLLILLSYFSFIKPYLFKDLSLALSIKNLFPMKANFIYYALLEGLMQTLFFLDDYFIFVYPLLTSYKYHYNNEHLTYLYDLSNILYVIFARVSVFTTYAMVDWSLRFIPSNNYASLYDRIKLFLRHNFKVFYPVIIAFDLVFYLILPLISNVISRNLPSLAYEMEAKTNIFDEIRNSTLNGILFTPYYLTVSVTKVMRIRDGYLYLTVVGIAIFFDIILVVVGFYYKDGRNLMHSNTISGLIKFSLGILLYRRLIKEIELVQYSKHKDYNNEIQNKKTSIEQMDDVYISYSPPAIVNNSSYLLVAMPINTSNQTGKDDENRPSLLFSSRKYLNTESSARNSQASNHYK